MKSGLLTVVLAIIFIVAVSAELQIRSASRNIDLTSQLAKHTVTLTLEDADTTNNNFELSLDAESSQHLSYLRVTQEGVDVPLTVSAGVAQNTSRGEGYVSYIVTFNRPVERNTPITVVVNYVFTHRLHPFPASVTQDENQFLRYTDSVYLFSSYRIQSQTTTVKVATSKIESHTEVPPVKARGTTVTYGPYTDVPSFASKPFSVHFLSNQPLLTVSKLVREIEISHWGNVAVEETYYLVHDGARLSGHFSRYDYQRNPQGAPTAVKSIRQLLPLGAEDIYYRDEIGNISTSHITVNNKSLVLELIPRFPLFGGWKTDFYMGYNLRLNSVLGIDRASGRYVLNTTILPRFQEELVFDEVEVRVIVPEGSSDLQLRTPFEVDSQSIDKRYTYLDTKGRPVLIFHKRNMVSEHLQNLQVSYSFASSYILHEPFLLVGSFFAFFLIVIVGVRLSLKIERGSS